MNMDVDVFRLRSGKSNTYFLTVELSLKSAAGGELRWPLCYVLIFMLYNTQEYYDVRAVVVKCRSTK